MWPLIIFQFLTNTTHSLKKFRILMKYNRHLHIITIDHWPKCWRNRWRRSQVIVHTTNGWKNLRKHKTFFSKCMNSFRNALSNVLSTYMTQCVLPFENPCFNKPEPHITWHLLTSIYCLVSRYPIWPDIISPLYLVWSAGIPCGLTHYWVLWHWQRHLHLDQKCQNDSCRSSVLSWWTLTLLQHQNHSWLYILLCW